MDKLKIAANPNTLMCFETHREIIDVHSTDFSDVAAVVLDAEDVERGMVDHIEKRGLGIPIFVAAQHDDELDSAVLPALQSVFELCGKNSQFYGKQLETAAARYENELMPPFFNTLAQYVEMGNATFACPGHQGGEFFRRHPAGRRFFEFYGEALFRSDMCNADVKLGDLLIHEGAPCEAQKHAARVYNADKTYFVLNGTSSANKVVTNALLTRGDLVLFDRNNHKSNHHGALIQAGATPVYLETSRNPYGFIGGVDAHCFDERFLREKIRQVAPDRATQARPFRLAIIQLSTYDGTIYNARYVIDKIGHLCDYILFDSAWAGYEQFIPILRDCSPLLLELGANDPGIIVTQSVHKQQAGFSQASQIHKKDRHIKGQDRYCNHKRFNNAFMLHASTSPFYPLFASLDVNAKIHAGESGRQLWYDCVRVGIEARKMLFDTCSMIKPFIVNEVDGKPWQSYDTKTIADDLRFFTFSPTQDWHAFEGYEASQYFVDPCKLLLTTPGIDLGKKAYSEFGIPAAILASYLRENGVVPEKCDLNSILFLLTPAEDIAKMQHLIAMIAHFEKHIENNSPLCEVLPTLCQNYEQRYLGYTIRQLCQEMHDLYVKHDIKTLQKNMFRERHFPRVAMSPQDANMQLVRGNVELIPISKADGRIAADGALPYPPGVMCVVPGEIWGDAVQHYFLALEDCINKLPGFAPELQGVYVQQDDDGKHSVYGYVIKQ